LRDCLKRDRGKLSFRAGINAARSAPILRKLGDIVQRVAVSDEALGSSREAHLSWGSGSVYAGAQDPQKPCLQKFVRNDVAIGVLLPEEPSEVTWRIGGAVALYRASLQTPTAPDLIVVPPGHEFDASGRGGQILWLFFDPRTISDDESVKSFAEKVRVDSSWSKDRLLSAVVAEIRKECSNGFPRGPRFLERAAMMFVTQLAYFFDRPAPRFEPRALSAAKLQLVIEYLKSNLNRNITLAEISDLVDLTPRYFCAAFKKVMGRPPHQFQIELRVERAKKLLSDPNMSLVDIALALGFSSQSHLCDYFRRIMGVTPARYRAEIQAKACRLPAGPHALNWAGKLAARGEPKFRPPGEAARRHKREAARAAK